MKIVFLTDVFYPSTGGIEVHSETLANELYFVGNEVHLITWTPDSAETKYPFAIIRNPSQYTLIKQYLWADIVIENNPSLKLSWPLYFLSKPHIVVIHTWIRRSNGEVSWQDNLKYKWIKRANAVVAISEAIRKKVFPAAVVIDNPYMSDLFKKLPYISRTKSFVYLGRLVSDKGVKTAVEAFSKFYKSIANNEELSKDCYLTIIGEGPEKAFLEKRVIDLQIQNRVKFTGVMKGGELVEELNHHSYLLVPSIWEEPFGIVALEGMACGCIPIVSNRGGLPDAIGEAGVTFASGSEDDLVKIMSRLIFNEQLCKELRNKAQQHLSEHTAESITKCYSNLIMEVVNKRRI